MAEVFPTNLKSFGSSMATVVNWGFAIMGYRFYNWENQKQIKLVFFIIICMLGILLISFHLPETKGKKFNEIQRKLGLWDRRDY